MNKSEKNQATACSATLNARMNHLTKSSSNWCCQFYKNWQMQIICGFETKDNQLDLLLHNTAELKRKLRGQKWQQQTIPRKCKPQHKVALRQFRVWQQKQRQKLKMKNTVRGTCPQCKSQVANLCAERGKFKTRIACRLACKQKLVHDWEGWQQKERRWRCIVSVTNIRMQNHKGCTICNEWHAVCKKRDKRGSSVSTTTNWVAGGLGLKTRSSRETVHTWHGPGGWDVKCEWFDGLACSCQLFPMLSPGPAFRQSDWQRTLGTFNEWAN